MRIAIDKNPNVAVEYFVANFPYIFVDCPHRRTYVSNDAGDPNDTSCQKCEQQQIHEPIVEWLSAHIGENPTNQYGTLFVFRGRDSTTTDALLDAILTWAETNGIYEYEPRHRDLTEGWGFIIMEPGNEDSEVVILTSATRTGDGIGDLNIRALQEDRS